MDSEASLTHLLEAQSRLQEGAFGIDVTNLADEQLVEFVRWNVLALTDELHEMLAECSWKPWQTDVYADRDRMQGELIDALHFLLNLLLATGNAQHDMRTRADEIIARYDKKHGVNEMRQRDGYDGRSGKCPECHRDLSESGVIQRFDGTQLCFCGHVLAQVPTHPHSS